MPEMMNNPRFDRSDGFSFLMIGAANYGCVTPELEVYFDGVPFGSVESFEDGEVLLFKLYQQRARLIDKIRRLFHGEPSYSILDGGKMPPKNGR